MFDQFEQFIERAFFDHIAVGFDDRREQQRIEILVMHEADTAIRLHQHRALLVDPRAEQGIGLFADVRGQVERRVQSVGQAINMGRVIQIDKHALRAILKIPAARIVMRVVAADKRLQCVVADGLALDQPVAAPVQREPAVNGGHVRPLGHRAQDGFIHGVRCSFVTAVLVVR